MGKAAKGEKKSTIWTENNGINEYRLAQYIAEYTYNDHNKKRGIDYYCVKKFQRRGIVLSRDAIRAKRKCILKSELSQYALTKLREEEKNRKQQELEEEQENSDNDGSDLDEDIDDEDNPNDVLPEELERIPVVNINESIDVVPSEESSYSSASFSVGSPSDARFAPTPIRLVEQQQVEDVIEEEEAEEFEKFEELLEEEELAKETEILEENELQMEEVREEIEIQEVATYTFEKRKFFEEQDPLDSTTWPGDEQEPMSQTVTEQEQPANVEEEQQMEERSDEVEEQPAEQLLIVEKQQEVAEATPSKDVQLRVATPSPKHSTPKKQKPEGPTTPKRARRSSNSAPSTPKSTRQIERTPQKAATKIKLKHGGEENNSRVEEKEEPLMPSTSRRSARIAQ
uniref:Uncharacterized protein n=1 Tax=Acrobeloides nanus TaxID=290746 RepID=A0A914CRH2_9BILA